MAKVKIKTVGAKKPLRPKPRPDNLEKVNKMDANVAVPELKSTKASDIHVWAEGLRDNYQAANVLLTVKGIVDVAEKSFTEPEELASIKAALKNIYAGGDGAATPAPKGTAKKAAAGAKAKKGNGKPRAAAVEATPVKFRNNTKIPVEWLRGTKNRCRVFPENGDGGYPLTAFVRYLGKKGWANEQTAALLTKMGLGEYHHDMKNHIIGAHMSAGRTDNGDLYGPIPKLKPEEVKLVEGHRK